jgi:hypothetical protein
MIIERTKEKYQLGNSLMLGFIIMCVTFFIFFLILMILYGSGAYAWTIYNFVDFMLVMTITAFVVTVVIHNLYFNFNWHFKTRCVLCGKHKYLFECQKVNRFNEPDYADHYACKEHTILY